MSKKGVSVLFVCLGNICRSPSAQMVFESLVEKYKKEKLIHIDSCGTAAYHIGKKADARSRAAAKKRGYQTEHLRARQLEAGDFDEFDYILAMDFENLSNIRDVQPPKALAQVALFMDFHPDESIEEVPDPYYGGDQGFENVLDLIETASENFYQFLLEKHPELNS